MQVPFASLPAGANFVAGTTWHFQFWVRDVDPGPTSNTSDSVEVTFQ
jgi:hypothetical protein